MKLGLSVPPTAKGPIRCKSCWSFLITFKDNIYILIKYIG